MPKPSYKSWQTDPEVVALIDRLLDEYTGQKVPGSVCPSARLRLPDCLTRPLATIPP